MRTRRNMEAISAIRANMKEGESENPIGDTTFVLFFLALDFGQNMGAFGLDTMIISTTLLAIIVLPYFLTSTRNDFRKWMLGRVSIALFALLLGVMFKQSLGVVLPGSFSFLPLTLLIITAMLSCYIQFYSFFRFRLSK